MELKEDKPDAAAREWKSLRPLPKRCQTPCFMESDPLLVTASEMSKSRVQ
jgi:hypothetical protein